jgi:hypothetical protein
MAILRAGPWGNLSDSFQNTPPAVNKRLYHYPVNIANGDWPNQEWLAWYEAEESGCCAPAQITATWPVTYDFGSTVTYTTETLDILEDCSYYYAQYPGGTYFPDYEGETFSLVWSGSAWQCYFGNGYFAQVELTTLNSTDECDPTGVTTISGTVYYNGYTITVIDPNA